MGIQKARRDYKSEAINPPQEIKRAPKELWIEIVEKLKSLGSELIGF